jgi:hypothetical protein
MKDTIIQYVRLARGAQAGGYYGLAKLFWALAFSEEITGSSAAGIPRGGDLLRELERVRAALAASGDNAALLHALDAGMQSVRDNGTASFVDIPDVRVSRTSGQVVIGDVAGGMVGDEDVLDMRHFLAIHYFEPLSPAQVQAALREFPTRLTEQLEGLSEAQLTAQPFAGEWSVRELLHHFAMAQALLHDRLAQMLAADNPTLKGMAVWAMSAGEASAAELLQNFRDSRAQTLALLDGLPAAAWWRGGYHDEFGPVTILSQATYFARHERNHVPQLLALLHAAREAI